MSMKTNFCGLFGLPKIEAALSALIPLHCPGFSLDRPVVHLSKSVFGEGLNTQREKKGVEGFIGAGREGLSGGRNLMLFILGE